jgi:hypothetical protein
MNAPSNLVVSSCFCNVGQKEGKFFINMLDVTGCNEMWIHHTISAPIKIQYCIFISQHVHLQKRNGLRFILSNKGILCAYSMAIGPGVTWILNLWFQGQHILRGITPYSNFSTNLWKNSSIIRLFSTQASRLIGKISRFILTLSCDSVQHTALQ